MTRNITKIFHICHMDVLRHLKSFELLRYLGALRCNAKMLMDHILICNQTQKKNEIKTTQVLKEDENGLFTTMWNKNILENMKSVGIRRR